MSVLVISTAERIQIAAIVAWAKANPVPFEIIRKGITDHLTVLHLKDRDPAFDRPRSRTMVFPGGYRASFSCEEQPEGLCSHLSISVEGRSQKGMMPNQHAVKMIAEEFGVPCPAENGWIEEFEPGEFAVNLVSLYRARQSGNA